jgi:hypothetical protein
MKYPKNTKLDSEIAPPDCKIGLSGLLERCLAQGWITDGDKIQMETFIQQQPQEDMQSFYDWIVFAETSGIIRSKDFNIKLFSYLPFVIVDTSFPFGKIKNDTYALKPNGFLEDAYNNSFIKTVLRLANISIPKLNEIMPLGYGFDYRKINLEVVNRSKADILRESRDQSGMDLGKEINIKYIATNDGLVELCDELMDYNKFGGGGRTTGQSARWQVLVAKHKGFRGKW